MSPVAISNGKSEHKARTLLLSILQPQIAAVRLNESARDCQSQTRSGGAGPPALERTKQALAISFRDTWSTIFDFNADRAVVTGCSGDNRRGWWSVQEGIFEQVRHDLVDLGVVARYGREFFGDFYADFSAGKSRLEAVDHGPNQFSQILGMAAECQPSSFQSGGVEQVGDQAIESVGFLLDLGQQFGAILLRESGVRLAQAGHARLDRR